MINRNSSLLWQLFFSPEKQVEGLETKTREPALLKTACALAVIGALFLLAMHSAGQASIHNRLGHRKITVGLWAGISAGSALSAIIAIPLSHIQNMYHHTENDGYDTLEFLGSTFCMSLVVIHDLGRMGLEMGCVHDICSGR